jgi:hypothetical protein
MKKLIATLAMLTMVGIANADILVLFPDGDFDSPPGASTNWVEGSCCGNFVFTYPSTGGNPGGYGTIENQGPLDYYGLWVNGDSVPLSLGSLGLIAGQTYDFVQDMKIISGANIGGLKIDFFPNTVSPNTTGDLRPASGTTSWATYTNSITIPVGTTGIKVVPLWGQLSKVAYDNIGVIVPSTPLTVSITSPIDGATVNTNFTINATAVVSPQTVTNVYFYDGATLLGNDTSFPYSLAVSNSSWTGSHVLKVVARDSSGNEATSADVTVNIVAAPQPALTYPTKNAPTPIWPVVSVNSMYTSSGTYTDRAGVSWFPWGDTSLRGNYAISGGNIVKSYLGLSYAGVELNPSYNPATAYDASGMTTLHVDVWTTANQLAIKMVSTINGAAPELIYDAASGVITSNQWISLDIPLSVFTNLNPALDLSKIDQLLWIDNGDIPGPGVQRGDFYIDNVFFYNNTPVIQSPTQSGSDFLCKVASQTGFDYVLQGTPSLTPATWTSIQTNAGTGGLLSFAVPTTGNPKRFFRIQTQ